MHLRDQISLLCRLGLATNQAKIYLTLAKSSCSTAYQVAKAANVSTEAVYRAMSKLQEKGLVEKEVTTPAKFRATPLKVAMDMLLNQKSVERIEIEMKARELLDTFVIEDSGKLTPEESRTVLIPGGERLIAFIRERIGKAKQEFHAIIPYEKFAGWPLVYTKLLEDMLLRKVRVKVVIPGVKKNNIGIISEEFLNDSNLELSFVPKDTLAAVTIQDGEEAMISTSIKTPSTPSPVFWSNHPSIVALCENYFNAFECQGKIFSPRERLNVRTKLT